jgi:ATP-binding cassette subfamily B protein RaxB
VIIAHRPETIASADRVLVMHAGAIARELRPSQPDETEQQAVDEAME